MDPTTNTDTPAEIPADAQDADDVQGSIATPVTPSLASYVGGGPSLTARARGSLRQRQLLQAAVNAFIRDDDDPSSVELADAISCGEGRSEAEASKLVPGHKSLLRNASSSQAAGLAAGSVSSM